MSARVLFLPSANEASWRWVLVEGGAVTSRGEGLPAADETPVTVIAPAEDVALHWAELPARSLAQASAAARLLVAEASLTPIGDLHVAVGDEGTPDRPIGVVSRTRMAEWLALLASHNIDPAAIIPAPMLLPRPEEGYVRADFGGDGVVRGPNSGFADEAPLTELVTGGIAPHPLERDAIEAAVAAAIAAPPLDLRQGAYARREASAFDWKQLRRAGWLAAAILLVTLAINLVQIGRYALAADAIDRRADAIARAGLPRGETVNDAERQLAARLVRLRGAGAGFSQTAAALFSAVRAVPGSELRALSFDPTGAVHATLVTENEGQVTDVRNHVAAMGLSAMTSTITNDGGKYSGELTVAPR